MKTICGLLAVLTLAAAGCRSAAPAHVRGTDDGAPPMEVAEPGETNLPGIGDVPDVVAQNQPAAMRDPLEPLNRAFFQFNDKLYFWVLKPVSKGYAYVVPQTGRRGVRNFFSNLATPVRLVNCTLQAEFTGAWVEVERFAINTTVGVAGFGDPARKWWHMEKHDEDLGQTLGRYGVGPSIYINWPVLGPSCVRDTVGLVGDSFLDPVNYVVPRTAPNVAVKSVDVVNGTSLRPGEYEDFKDAAIDPYSALRDAYYQYRSHLVTNAAAEDERPAGPLPTP